LNGGLGNIKKSHSKTSSTGARRGDSARYIGNLWARFDALQQKKVFSATAQKKERVEN
jgi:hypothetical protein